MRKKGAVPADKCMSDAFCCTINLKSLSISAIVTFRL
jgi:hypothetical protein